jgi:hypothetical protein
MSPTTSSNGRRSRSEGVFHIGLGLLMFGLSLGMTVGLSTQPGISQTLLTSLLGFVGGVLLTYAGFQRRTEGPGDTPRLDTRAVGIGLACFSVGTLVGMILGIYLRTVSPLARNAGESRTQQQSEEAFSLHSELRGNCASVNANFVQGIYRGPAGAEAAVKDLQDFVRVACN